MSADGDSYLYLLAEDGSRITDNDDGGADLNARIERNLAAGVYLVEVTTVGGRGRGPADFTLSIGHVTGCEPVHLGTLQPGGPLAVSGSWTLDTCGSRVVAEHPAHAYSFNLPQDGRVLIDLTSVDGDPVLSLATSDGRFIGQRRRWRPPQLTPRTIPGSGHLSDRGDNVSAARPSASDSRLRPRDRSG